MTDLERLIFDLKGIAKDFHFTATRIGEPGCAVRKKAQADDQIIQRAIAELRKGLDDGR